MGPYRDHLVAVGLSERTIKVYVGKVKQARDWCRKHSISLRDITPSQLRELAAGFPNTHSTLRQLRSALGHYFEMTGRDTPPLKAIRVPKKPNYRNRALSVEDARALAKTARFWLPEGLAVGFGLYMALRVHEIATVRWSRFDENMEWYRVTGKGDETYELPVHPILQDDLRYAPRENDYVFPGRGRREHVTDATVWKWVRSVSEAAGIGPVETHVLRHTCLTTANDMTGDLRAVSAFARHKRIETTRLYTRTTAAQLERVVFAINYDTDQ